MVLSEGKDCFSLLLSLREEVLVVLNKIPFYVRKCRAAQILYKAPKIHKPLITCFLHIRL